VIVSDLYQLPWDNELGVTAGEVQPVLIDPLAGRKIQDTTDNF